MASTIAIPSASDVGAFSSEVQTASVSRGDYDSRVAQNLIDVATAAKADIEALQAGTSIASATAGAKGVVQLAGDLAGTGGTAAAPRVSGINSATVPAGGALTTGNVLQVTAVSTLSYAAVNLAGGSNYVTGVLPVANVATTAGIVHSVRGVVTTNVADLGAFTVATHDGLTFVEGDRILLAKQSTAAQDGIYVVGAVSVGAAPLTRAADWAAAMVLPAGSRVVVNEGTAFKHSEWFASLAGAITVATSAPAFYPKRVKGTTVAMTAGSVAVSNTWILSDSTSVAMLSAKTPGGTQGTLSCGTLTAGAGSGSFTISSDSGTDTSTVSYLIEN
jgi:hypothetical protein